MFEKLYNIACKPILYKFFIVLLVLEILFLLLSSLGLFSEFSSHPLFRLFLVILLLILLFGIYVVIVNSYLNQEKKAGKNPSYKKFKKKYLSILLWMLLIGVSSTLFTKYTITDSKSTKINKCTENYSLSIDRCNQFYNVGKNSKPQVLSDNEVKNEFINSCVSKSADEDYCNCAFDKILDKYTSEEYIILTADFAKSIHNGTTSVELKEFWEYFKNIPELCRISITEDIEISEP